MRSTLFPLDDEDLATALAAVAKMAAAEGWRYDGFMGWTGDPIGDFIATNFPGEEEAGG